MGIRYIKRDYPNSHICEFCGTPKEIGRVCPYCGGNDPGYIRPEERIAEEKDEEDDD